MPSFRCECGAKYKFPDSALGKKAKCKKCGVVFRLKPPDTSTIPIADESPFAAEISSAARKAPPPAPKPPPNYPGLVIETAEDSKTSTREATDDVPAKGYWGSIFWTLFFPSNIGNLITFLVIWFVLSLVPLFAASWIGLGFFILVSFWYIGFRFDVVQSSAGGDENLPKLGFSGDYWDELFLPALRWLGSWVVVTLPAVVYLFIRYDASAGDVAGVLLEGIAGLILGFYDDYYLLAMLGLGFFLWPMIILCLALEGFSAVSRVDYILATIVRSIPAYAFTVFLVFATMAADVYVQYVIANAAAGGPTSVGAGLGVGLLTRIASTGVALYLEIVMLRVIGLYYHHFKDKFPWGWG